MGVIGVEGQILVVCLFAPGILGFRSSMPVNGGFVVDGITGDGPIARKQLAASVNVRAFLGRLRSLKGGSGRAMHGYDGKNQPRSVVSAEFERSGHRVRS